MRFTRTAATALLFLAATFVAAPADARDVNSNAGTSAFPFLKINIGARAVGMGGAFTGVSDDENALYYNPAGLATMRGNRFIAGYHNYFEDIQNGLVGYFTELREGSVIGGYISYLNHGDFVETDADGNVLGEFTGGDLLIGGSYAMSINRFYQVGGSVKLMYESIRGYSATGAAVDLGARYNSDRNRYRAGIAIQNLGIQFSALGDETEKLPITFRAGGSALPKGLPVLVAADVIVPIDNDPVVAFGLEYSELRPMHLRVGWTSFGSNYRAEDSDDVVAGLSFGAGFDFKRTQISYAVTLGADLGESHRITWSGEF